jgi:hypothetical protein
MMRKPKILNLSTPTLRNQRTLIWLQNQSSTIDWSKWDGIITSLDAFKNWSETKSKIVGMCLTTLHPNTEWLDTLHGISKKVPLILLSQSILSLKPQSYWDENYDNILNLNGILEQYPFIYKPWDGTNEDAIAIFALLCRYNRIIDCPISSERKTIMPNNIIFESATKPNEIWLITQFFRHENNRRHRELKECLVRNCACTEIDKIVLINEKDYSDEYRKIPGAQKIHQVISGQRLTYADFLKYVHNEVPMGVFAILANADIYFGADSLRDLFKIDLTDKMLGLLRWDDNGEGADTSVIFGPRADSQDTWIFLSDSIRAREWDYSKFNFQLGQAGCDNAFAGQILRNRFYLSNPAMTFKTYHLHNTNIRNYSKADMIQSDLYINLAPSYIIDTRQEITPGRPISVFSNELVSFEVKSSSMSNEITYCTMLEKEGRFKWEPSVENHYFEPTIPVYNWSKACVSPSGLVYDLFTIYKGEHSENPLYNYWKTAKVDILTPLQKCGKMLAVPFMTTDIFRHPDLYILNYISRVRRLLKSYPGAGFWVPPQFSDYLEYLDWGSEINPVLFDEGTACWADEVVGFLPGPMELGAEDIQCLRDMLPSYVNTVSEKVCAIVVSGAITSGFASVLTDWLLERDNTWSVRIVDESNYASYDALIGASLCIVLGGKKTATWSRLWALPPSAKVIEFQQELQIDGEFQHLAHIAGLVSWVLLLSKGSLEDVHAQILGQLEKWWKKNSDQI